MNSQGKFSLKPRAKRLAGLAFTPPRSSPTGARRLLVGFSIVTPAAAIHALHSFWHGYSLWLSSLSGASIVSQCGALTLFLSLARRWRFSDWQIRAGCVVVSCLFGPIILVPHSYEWPLSQPEIAFWSVLAGHAVTGLWLLAFELPLFVNRARLHGMEVESLRREAELSRLRVHLHPHFLLNTLNAIAGLVTEDPAEACRLIAALGDLVRDALVDRDELQPFRVEVAWLQRYAEILETRHRGFLSFRWEIAPETLDVRAPYLLLQPLVENAIKHGALRRHDGGSVLIRSETVSEGATRFVIEDNGPGLAQESSEGLGISLVRRRLALLCQGATICFEQTLSGARVVVEIKQTLKERT